MNDYDEGSIEAIPLKEAFQFAGKLVDLVQEAKITERQIMGKMIDYAREAKITDRILAIERSRREIAMTAIMEHYRLQHAILDKTFEKQYQIIEKLFDFIDKGLEKNNSQAINAGMEGIVTIAKDNPSSKILGQPPAIQHKMLEDGDLGEL